MLEKILRILESKAHPVLPATGKMVVYDNKTLMATLGIKDKYLKKLRDNGYLGYSREGDKYWYTGEDVEKFLRKFHYRDFAAPSDTTKLW